MRKLLILILLIPVFIFAADEMIKIKGDPEVKIYLDRNFAGVTKKHLDVLLIKDVSVGPHFLIAVKDGFQPQVKQVNIEEGKEFIWELDDFVPIKESDKKSTMEALKALGIQGDSQTEETQNFTSDNMIFVKGGRFRMGSAQGEDDEIPIHEVVLTDYYIGRFEVTVGEFRKFIKATNYKTGVEKIGFSFCWVDNKWKRIKKANWSCDLQGKKRSVADSLYPVIHINWYDALHFCNWKSKEDGYKPCYKFDGYKVSCDWEANGYRLPTEAEWEFAATGGLKSYDYVYSGSNVLDEVAWFSANSFGSLHKVGQKKPNELGTHDMSGNVWEWCWDFYGRYTEEKVTNPHGPEKGRMRVIRGGSWGNNPSFNRVTYRYRGIPDGIDHYTAGFRLVRKK